jgi:hypothetical protein
MPLSCSRLTRRQQGEELNPTRSASSAMDNVQSC